MCLTSVWIAQRNGRSKDGHDVTEQGLLKMFEMSGSGDFVKDFKELSILPIAISYQYEPCDFLKARELYISRRERYFKKPGEDTVSILTGVRQDKGCIAFHFCPEITVCGIPITWLMTCLRAERHALPAIRRRAVSISCGVWKRAFPPWWRKTLILIWMS